MAGTADGGRSAKTVAQCAVDDFPSTESEKTGLRQMPRRCEIGLPPRARRSPARGYRPHQSATVVRKYELANEVLFMIQTAFSPVA
jgi:hypothetical protein